MQGVARRPRDNRDRADVRVFVLVQQPGPDASLLQGLVEKVGGLLVRQVAGDDVIVCHGAVARDQLGQDHHGIPN